MKSTVVKWIITWHLPFIALVSTSQPSLSCLSNILACVRLSTSKLPTKRQHHFGEPCTLLFALKQQVNMYIHTHTTKTTNTAKITFHWIFFSNLHGIYSNKKIIYGLPSLGTFLIVVTHVLRMVMAGISGDLKVRYVKGHETIGICVRTDWEDEGDDFSTIQKQHIIWSQIFGGVISFVDLIVGITC